MSFSIIEPLIQDCLPRLIPNAVNVPHGHQDYVFATSGLKKRFWDWRVRIIRDYTEAPSCVWWDKVQLEPLVAAHRLIAERISSGVPTCVARIGNVEASICMWGQGIAWPLGWRGQFPVLFCDTFMGASNAGLRPRNHPSYRLFSTVMHEALSEVDVLGVWRNKWEAALLRAHFASLGQVATVDVEGLGPTMIDIVDHWMNTLNGLRVLIVSPFVESIYRQMERIESVWPTRRWFRDCKVIAYRFPFLIDESCKLTWWEVYESVGRVVQDANYDVALFGCGGLGLPLAALAKRSERIGIHLGGLLQLAFGIYGERHLTQDWHRRCINDAWIRPSTDETPACARKVENSCYW